MDFSAMKVMVGIPCYGAMPVPTVHSLIETVARATRVNLPTEVVVTAGCAVVTAARDEIADRFLCSDCTHLFWIDADMQWTADDFMRLLDLTCLEDHPVVGATYPAKSDSLDLFLSVTPIMVDGEPHVESRETGCFVIDGMGMGFVVMRREVVEAVARDKPVVLNENTGQAMRAVFRVDTTASVRDGQDVLVRRGEDMAFFADCRAAGFDVLVDPAMGLGHVGMKVYRRPLLQKEGA
jgi:hypothetical protein